MPFSRSSRPISLHAAFRRRTCLTCLTVTAFAAVVFVVITARHDGEQMQAALDERARVCVAALTPGAGGELSGSVERLQDRYRGLVAVATLDVYGAIESVYPSRPAQQEAARAMLANPDHRVTMPSAFGRQPMLVRGCTVPLNGTNDSATRQVLVLLSSREENGSLTQLTLTFAAVVAMLGLLTALRFNHWCHRNITSYLRSVVRTAKNPLRHSRQIPEFPSTRLKELSDVTAAVARFMTSTAEAETRLDEMELETAIRLKQREKGFNQQLRRAQDQATTDTLTKLRNRAFLEEELEPIFEGQRLVKRDMAAVMIDVDNFKPYNDRRGHQVGDALLRFVGALLRGTIRPTDHAIRYGGDEFLLLLPDTDAEQASVVADRIVKLFAQNAMRLGKGNNLSLSAGIASMEADQPETADNLISKADQALYAAKGKGKNTVVTFQAA